MLRGVLLSFILHVFIILLVIYVIPEFFSKSKRDIEIAVDIIAIDELIAESSSYKKPVSKLSSSVKEKKVQKKDDNKIREKKKVKPKKLPELFPSKKPKKKGDKKVVPVVVAPKKKVGERVSKKTVSDGKGEGDEELDDILNEIKRVQKEVIEDRYREEYIYGKGLTPQEKHNIKRQINSCWNNIVKKLFSREEIIDIRIKVIVSLDLEGNVLNARLADSVQDYMKLDNSLYRQVADSALSTFYRCKHITNLPKDKYDYWKEFEFTFNPTKMILEP